ncbi:MAG: cysteine desulfurase family protein [Pseudomonadota bacterium]|nr:cysteine desulfurase family protein [Pseudomonadota bacterium]
MRFYLDYNASAPMDERVKSYVKEIMDLHGNPSSIHTKGRKLKNILEISRQRVALLTNCNRKNIIFTSGATEANNLALNGYKKKIVSCIEHESIKRQKNTMLIDVNKEGYIDLVMLENILKGINNKKEIIVSVMFANNETGIIQPIEKIIKITKKYKVPFHTDGVQAVGRINIDFLKLGIDMMTISSHKIGGPIGAGALIVASKKHILKPLLFGGDQEDSLRSGTEPLLAIAGFGQAAELLEIKKIEKLKALRLIFEKKLKKCNLGIQIIGENINRLPNTFMMYTPGIKAEDLLIALDLEGFDVSTGSACSSGKAEPSAVLKRMGYSKLIASGVIRISLGLYNDINEADMLVNALKKILKRFGKI